MKRYLMLLYDSPTDFQGLSAEEMQRIIGEYSAWAESLRQQDRLLSAEKLEDGTGRVLHGSDEGLRILDGPYSETKEVVGGFFLIQADDWDQAVELAKASPHLRYDGTIELRAVDEHE